MDLGRWLTLNSRLRPLRNIILKRKTSTSSGVHHKSWRRKPRNGRRGDARENPEPKTLIFQTAQKKYCGVWGITGPVKKGGESESSSRTALQLYTLPDSNRCLVPRPEIDDLDGRGGGIWGKKSAGKRRSVWTNRGDSVSLPFIELGGHILSLMGVGKKEGRGEGMTGRRPVLRLCQKKVSDLTVWVLLRNKSRCGLGRMIANKIRREDG